MTSLNLKDCAFTLQMGGVSPAYDLGELIRGLRECSIDCLYHHFCHPMLHGRHETLEFQNDLAIWAAEELRDRVLAERLSMINPFALGHLEELRRSALGIVETRLSESEAPAGIRAMNAFRFIRAVTVVFPTKLELHSSADLLRALGEISDHSLYYHFIEARTANGHREDDFSTWLASLPDASDALVESIRELDFYYMSLDEIRNRLIHLLGGQ